VRTIDIEFLVALEKVTQANPSLVEALCDRVWQPVRNGNNHDTGMLTGVEQE